MSDFKLKIYSSDVHGETVLEILVIDKTDMQEYYTIFTVNKLEFVLKILSISVDEMINMLKFANTPNGKLKFVIIKGYQYVTIEYLYPIQFDCLFYYINGFCIDIYNNNNHRFRNKVIIPLTTPNLSIELSSVHRHNIHHRLSCLLLVHCHSKCDIIYTLLILHTYILQDFIHRNKFIYKEYFHPNSPNKYLRDINKFILTAKNIDILYMTNFIQTWVVIVNGIVNSYIRCFNIHKAHTGGLLSFVNSKPRLHTYDMHVFQNKNKHYLIDCIKSFILNNREFFDWWQIQIFLFIAELRKEAKGIGTDCDFIGYIQENIIMDLFTILHRDNDEVHHYL